MIKNGATINSPGGSFTYYVVGPVCRLFDREELPWPCCSLQWKGKQPSWNRIGRRFVPDISAQRFASYNVYGQDFHGSCWEEVKTIYGRLLSKQEKRWWYSPRNERNDYPDYVES